MFLNEFINTNNKVARSVNIERDAEDIDQINRFHITSTVVRILKRFADSLDGEPVSAWSLTGPYGSGKSSFCNYLFSLCSKDPQIKESAYDKLNFKEPDLALRIKKSTQNIVQSNFILIRALSQYEPLNKTISRSLKQVLSQLAISYNASKKLKFKIENLCTLQNIPTSEIIDFINELHDITKEPLLIVIDEFGKNLEYMAHNPDSGDIYVLQMLAESSFVYVYVCLHQAFNEYSSNLSKVQKNEWSKIQGRFEDIAYIEPPERTIDLVSEVINLDESSLTKNHKKLLENWSKKYSDLINEIDIRIIKRISSNDLKNLYPVNPLSVVILGELSKIFAQNERTIFSFFSSGDPKAFYGFLVKNRLNGKHLPSLGLDWLYDYFCEITTQVHSKRATTQKWIEIQSLIASCDSSREIELKILKTIGVLNLVTEIPGIKASKKIIYLALGIFETEDKKNIDDILNHLISKGILLYRGYADEYRLWEGTDFDIEKALAEERSKLASTSIETALNTALELPNIIAARHSYQKGVVREFSQSWVQLDYLEKNYYNISNKNKLDGHIFLVLGKGLKDDFFYEITRNNTFIIGCCSCENQIIDLVLDAAAAERVLNVYPQLKNDAVARREVNFRVDIASENLNNYLSYVTDPDQGEMEWYALGQKSFIKKGTGLSALASEVCDHVFNKSPCVNMEMINHNKLSPAASRAQRELIEAMVSCENEKNLGMEGFGPEVAIYQAMFKSTDLHVLSENNKTWELVRPQIKNSKQRELAYVWEALDEKLKTSELDSSDVLVTDLIKLLQEKPFGIRKGPIPLYIAHYLIVNDNEVALYQEGTFRPVFRKAEAALLLKRPDLFSLKRFYTENGLKKDVIQAYLNAINTDILEFDVDTRNKSLLKIVAPLIQFVNELPDYTLKTKRISNTAQKFRAVVLNSREPLDLLFKDIPEALDIPIIDSVKIDKKLKNELFQKIQDTLIELNTALDRLYDEVKDFLAKLFYKKKTQKFEDFRFNLKKRFINLISPCRDQELKALLKAFCNDSLDENRWVSGIAGIVVKKPVDSWKDVDVDAWYALMEEMAHRIKNFESLLSSSEKYGCLENRYILSLTDHSGFNDKYIIELDKEKQDELLKKFPQIKNMDKEEVKSLLAILLDEKVLYDN
ncbi:MAG: P-loop NTPase fold protein [Candidatus Muiribacteriota bacterium]